MALIKIAQPGYETFSSYMGTLEFKDGISVREPTAREIALIGSNIKIVEVGSEDEQIGPSVTMVNTRNISAHVEDALEREPEEPAIKTEPKYTEDELIRLGEDGGIKAVRAIADEFGVKGVSIDGLIAAIMEAQAKVK